MKTLACVAIVFIANLGGASSEFDWGEYFLRPILKNGSGSAGFGGMRLAVDAEGYYYLGGSFSGEARFGTNALKSTGPSDAFVAKYDRQTNCLWVRHIPVAQAGGVAASGSEAVFIAGSFTGVTVVASIPIRSRNRQDIFLAKYDGDGILLWFKQVTGGGPGATVTVDAGGNSYITGEFFGDGVFDGLPRYPERVRALFVAKYNPAGKLLWVRREGEGSANPRGATTDDSGNVYVTGTFFGEVKFGSQIIGAKGGEDLFLVKYDTNGNFLWVRAPGGPPFRTGHNVALDRGGNPHVVGIIERTSVFGRTNVVIIDPDENKFLAKYTPDGDFQWVRQFRKGDFDFSNVVSVEVIGVKRPMRSSGSTNSSTTSVLELQKRAEMVTAALNSQNAASGAIASRPVLGLQKSGEFILLFWSKEFADFVLEGSETLMPFPVWETVIVNPESIAEQLVVSIPIRDTVRFYRLRRP